MHHSEPAATEHPFATFVRLLGKGRRGSRDLTLSEAHDAMSMMLKGTVTDAQLGAFLMLMRVKEETPDEITGFCQAARAHLETPVPANVDIDWPSYAGKRRHAPWFLLSARLLAMHGVRVFLHGAGGHTQGRLYTEACLEYLDITTAQDTSTAEAALSDEGIVFMPLTALQSRLQRLITLKEELGLRTPVNSVARTMNPSQARLSLQSVFHPGYLDVHRQACQTLGYPAACIIKGEGGEFEVTPDIGVNTALVASGTSRVMSWGPVLPQRALKEPAITPDVLPALWNGRLDHAYGKAAVLQTAAIVLWAMGRAETPEASVAMAEALWEQRRPI